MGRRADLLVIFICYNILFVDRARCTRKISKEELDMEIQSKLLNKSSIKTIQVKYGDIIDCIDVHKELTSGHPLLKDHTIDFQGEMCPVGTIPVRRIIKTERQVLEANQKEDRNNRPKTYLAIARTKIGQSKFAGGGGRLKLYNPKAEGQQYSATRIRIQAGPNSIEAGWRVDPNLYGDSQTRFFIRTDAGQSHCFNVLCSGFIHTYKEFPLNTVAKNTSKPGESFLWIIIIKRNNANGNWDLFFDTRPEILIGYWPSKIFPGLADRVEWGGAAYSPPGTPLPPMGSGNHVTGNPDSDGFIVEKIVYSESGLTVHHPNVELYADDDKLYSVLDGNLYRKLEPFTFYGGPGHL